MNLGRILSCGIVLLAPPSVAAEQSRDAWDAAAGKVARLQGAAGAARLFPLHAMGSDVEVLQGDPEVAGKPFVIRIRELPGGLVPPHTHPVDENITVVHGTWYFGTGPAFDRRALKPLPAGSYAFAPKGTTMFGYSPDGAIVQVHGIGPFHIHWKYGAHTLSDRGDSKFFRFRIGEDVRCARGAGRVLEGYASGPIVQYEIRSTAGRLFMADEKDMQRR
jgi:quercetin dioxygenase-like cupin family protein